MVVLPPPQKKKTTDYKTPEAKKAQFVFLLVVLTICPETITEILCFQISRCKNYVTAPVRITVPKNNSRKFV